jgi:tripartite-type tricarboxylate transporter receptor subunit TctC
MKPAKWIIAACMLSCAATGVVAQEYPAKPVIFVVPFAPGGTNDLIGRPLAQKLSQSLGKPVVVENRGGAGGTIGTSRVVTAAPDGYTLLIGSAGPLGTAPGFYPNLSYDPIKDLSAVSLVMTSPILLLVNPIVPAKTVNDLIQLATMRPRELNYGSPGAGSMNHLAGELFDLMAKVHMVHVPYKGSGPAVLDIIAGRLDVMFAPVAPTLPYVRAGKLRAVAVGTQKRFETLPNLPTISEAGVSGYDVSQWWGIAAPAKTSDAIVQKLNSEIAKILQTSEIKDLYRTLGGEPTSSSPSQFSAFIRDETRKWSKVITAAHLQLSE